MAYDNLAAPRLIGVQRYCGVDLLPASGPDELGLLMHVRADTRIYLARRSAQISDQQAGPCAVTASAVSLSLAYSCWQSGRVVPNFALPIALPASRPTGRDSCILQINQQLPLISTRTSSHKLASCAPPTTRRIRATTAASARPTTGLGRQRSRSSDERSLISFRRSTTQKNSRARSQLDPRPWNGSTRQETRT